MSQLVTGEAVVLDLRTAGVPSRALAALIDVAIQGVALFALATLVGAFASSGNDAAAAAVTVVVTVAVALGYPVAMETLTRGRTLGKMSLGLRVVRDDGGPIRFRHALTRGLLAMFVEKPGITFGAAALITSLLNERGKRLGDFLAGTVVIQERVAVPYDPGVAMPPQLASWASMLDLSALPDDLAQSARSYLGRFHSLTEQAQVELGERIAARVASVVTPAVPPGVPAWAYLSAVLAERRRRALPVPAAFPMQYGPPSSAPPPAAAPEPPPTSPEPPAQGPFAPPA